MSEHEATKQKEHNLVNKENETEGKPGLVPRFILSETATSILTHTLFGIQ